MFSTDVSYVRPILNLTLLTGLAPKLSSSALIIFLLGTVTMLLSNVLILVLLNPTFSTMPVTPPNVTISPTVNGLSKKIVNYPRRFSKLSLDAKANATPPIPSPVTKAVIFTSNTSPKIITIPRTMVNTFATSIANGIN